MLLGILIQTSELIWTKCPDWMNSQQICTSPQSPAASVEKQQFHPRPVMQTNCYWVHSPLHAQTWSLYVCFTAACIIMPGWFWGAYFLCDLNVFESTNQCSISFCLHAFMWCTRQNISELGGPQMKEPSVSKRRRKSWAALLMKRWMLCSFWHVYQ